VAYLFRKIEHAHKAHTKGYLKIHPVAWLAANRITQRSCWKRTGKSAIPSKNKFIQ
jgi:hypothetical protein